MANSRFVFGIGINDADCSVVTLDRGKRLVCHYYRTWRNMLMRCYYKPYQDVQPSYKGCTVCEEWKYFSNFKSWMETQDWEGKQLDKDLLIKGNKISSPKTCVFLSKKLNNFILENPSTRGDLPIGVHLHEYNNKYRAMIRQGTNRARKHLGLFDTPEEAHKAWLTSKLEQAKLLAAEQTDPRIADALIKRYENY